MQCVIQWMSRKAVGSIYPLLPPPATPIRNQHWSQVGSGLFLSELQLPHFGSAEGSDYLLLFPLWKVLPPAPTVQGPGG